MVKLANGDKIKLIKPIGVFENVGEVCEVISIKDNIISFKCSLGIGCMTEEEFDKYFVKYEEEKSKTLEEKFKTLVETGNEIVDYAISNSKILVETVFDKCTIVSVQLPNGFVIVESSSCISPDDYDEDMSFDICMKKIIEKVIEMEAYVEQELSYDYDECRPCDEIPAGECCGDCDKCHHIFKYIK